MEKIYPIGEMRRGEYPIGNVIYEYEQQEVVMVKTKGNEIRILTGLLRNQWEKGKPEIKAKFPSEAMGITISKGILEKIFEDVMYKKGKRVR
jgi:hypothetical protein